MKTKLIYLPPIILCVLLLITPLAEAQEVDKSFNKTPQEVHDMFMKKSSTNSFMGVMSITVGIGLVAVGFASREKKVNSFFSTTYNTYTYSATSQALMISGGIITTASIPFFIWGGSNKRKAKLALNKEVVGIEVLNKSSNYGLSVTITF